MTSYNCIMLGCLTFRKIVISLLTLSTSPYSSIIFLSKIFIATGSFVALCSPYLTFPKVPSPKVYPKFINYTYFIVLYLVSHLL